MFKAVIKAIDNCADIFKVHPQLINPFSSPEQFLKIRLSLIAKSHAGLMLHTNLVLFLSLN